MARLILAAILFAAIAAGRTGAAPLLEGQDPGFVANCAKMHGSSSTAVAACVDSGERALVTGYVPAELPYYEELAAQRTRIAVALDAGRMRLDEAKAEMGAAWATFDERTRQIESAYNAALANKYGYTPEQMRAFSAGEAAAQANEAAEDRRIERERRAIAASDARADGLQSLGDSMRSAADSYGRAADGMRPPPIPDPPPPEPTFDPGYSQKPPPPVLCVGQVVIEGPSADACAGGP